MNSICIGRFHPAARAIQRSLFLLTSVLLGFSTLFAPRDAPVSPADSTEAAEPEATLPAIRLVPRDVRLFREVQPAVYPGAYHALSRISRNGGFTLLVEEDEAGRVISDTLLAWVQHFGEGQHIAPQARHADLLVTCYPQQIQDRSLRNKHVLPHAEERVWLYFLEGRRLVISAYHRRDGLPQQADGRGQKAGARTVRR